MNKDYRDTEYCPGYDKVLENKRNFMVVFRAQHPHAKDIHAYVSKNDSALKKDFVGVYNGKCAYCGTSIKIIPKSLFEIDHFVPQSSPSFNGSKVAAGGIDNLVLSCRTCNHNKSDFPVTAELQGMLHPDYEEIMSLFFRDEMYYIRVADGKPSEVTDFYKQLRLDRPSCRLDYLLLKMKGLYEKTADRPEVHNLLGQAISSLVEKRNIDC